MKSLVVLAHPERQSFNASMAEAAVSTLHEGDHETAFSDLYRDGFDPVSGRQNFLTAADPAFLKLQSEEMFAAQGGGFEAALEAEIQKFEAADLAIFQFPLWWFGMPAILKGWFDRVLAMGRIYSRGGVYASGHKLNRRALLSVTTGAPAQFYSEGGTYGDITKILKPMHKGIFEYLGYDVLAPQVVYQPARMTDAARAAEIELWQERLTDIASERPIDVGRYE